MIAVIIRRDSPRSASGLSFPLEALKRLCWPVSEEREERADLKAQRRRGFTAAHAALMTESVHSWTLLNHSQCAITTISHTKNAFG